MLHTEHRKRFFGRSYLRWNGSILSHDNDVVDRWRMKQEKAILGNTKIAGTQNTEMAVEWLWTVGVDIDSAWDKWARWWWCLWCEIRVPKAIITRITARCGAELWLKHWCQQNNAPWSAPFWWDKSKVLLDYQIKNNEHCAHVQMG